MLWMPSLGNSTSAGPGQEGPSWHSTQIWAWHSLICRVQILPWLASRQGKESYLRDYDIAQIADLLAR
jgi:hypothetical protein